MLRQSCRHFATIGFIGLGNMGSRMAPHLVKAHDVHVCDISSVAVDEAVKRGCKAGSSPKDIASKCQTLICMLPNASVLEEVYKGENGILRGIRPNSTVIECSTVDTETPKELAKDLEGLGCQLLDAPVSGGIMAAEKGTLTFMVGGPHVAYEHAAPILRLMGTNVFHCGPIGNGQAVKLCNNLMLAISMSGVCEVVTLGSKLGVDPKLLLECMNKSSGQCWVTSVYPPVPKVNETSPANRDYQGGFQTNLMLKDATLAVNAAERVGSPLRVGKKAQEIFQEVAKKHGNSDFGVVYKWLQTQ